MSNKVLVFLGPLGLCPLILLSLPSSLDAQLWSGILSPSRAVDWSNVGLPGGIPSGSWTQCGSTIAAGASVATINSAIANCTANHYVQLGAGTFNLSGGILFNAKSNVEIRGMGANQTFLVFSSNVACQGFFGDVCFQSTDVNWWGGPSNTADWTAGYSKGTTSITLSSKTNLSVGTPITLDQTDDPSNTDTGDIFVCYTPQFVCSTNGDSGGAPRSGRSQQQIVTVTSVSGSGPYTVGISPGIYMPNWVSAKSPQAWWANGPIFQSGIQNLSMDHSASEPSQGVGAGVSIFNCYGCWVRGVRSISAGRSHVQIVQSNRIMVLDSYFFNTAGHTSTSYGVEELPASDTLVQNNIFQQVAEPMPINGTCSGCVFAYNFDIDNLYNNGDYSWLSQGTYTHAVGDENILLEGNQGAGIYADNFHGTHHFVTAFRNVYNGFQKDNGNNPSGDTMAIILDSFARFYNIVGNVLGTASYHKAYEKNLSNGTTGVTNNTSIFRIGFGNQIPNDNNVNRTLMRWGNYDVVTAAVRWCGNSSDPGWSTTCSSTSEVPSAITNFANPVPSSTTLPASFYLSSKPSWWPSGKAWPPIGPDVSGGSLANLAGHANSIPAADCYANVMGGPVDGTGSVLSFNPAACYSQTVSSPPSPPTLVTAVAR